MSDYENRHSAGKIIKIVLLGLVLIIAAAVIYGVALLNGRAPLPRVATGLVSEKLGMSPGERESLEKVLNVYEILRTSEISDDVNDLRKMAFRGAPDEEITGQVYKTYSSLSPDTLEEIRKEMEITPDDFIRGKDIIDDAMAGYASSGEFSLSEEAEGELKALAEKYGWTEEDLEGWSGH